MQPGMPQGFGQIEGKPYFGLPGNPVSVFVSFELFVRPAMLKMMGRTQLDRPEVTATLTAEVSGPKGKMQYARVVVERGDDGLGRHPDRRPGLEPDLDGRARQRPRDDPAGHRDRAGRLAGAGHAVPLRRGLSRGGERARQAPTASPASSRSARSPRPSATRPPSAGSRPPPRPSAHLVAGTKKGDPIETAKIAGVIGVKQTPALLPHCHPIRVTGADVVVEPDEAAGRIRVETTVRATDRTGVEMEALTAAAVAALSLYDTAKAFDRAARIDGLRLLRKSGGKSGDYVAER